LSVCNKPFITRDRGEDNFIFRLRSITISNHRYTNNDLVWFRLPIRSSLVAVIAKSMVWNPVSVGWGLLLTPASQLFVFVCNSGVLALRLFALFSLTVGYFLTFTVSITGLFCLLQVIIITRLAAGIIYITDLNMTMLNKTVIPPESEYVDLIKAALDYGNCNVYKSFKLRLMIEYTSNLLPVISML
jgi:hypothetical protein